MISISAFPLRFRYFKISTISEVEKNRRIRIRNMPLSQTWLLATSSEGELGHLSFLQGEEHQFRNILISFNLILS